MTSEFKSYIILLNSVDKNYAEDAIVVIVQKVQAYDRPSASVVIN